MSNPIFRIDVTLPIHNWTEEKPDIEKCITCSQKKIDCLNDSDKTKEHIGSGNVNPEVDILMFCSSMLEAAKHRNVALIKVTTSRKSVIFSFGSPTERAYDKFYYNLVYILSQYGILKMKDSIKRRGSTE